MDGLDNRGSVTPGESLGTDATPEELARAIGLDNEEIQWRKDFIGFGAADAERLEALQPVVEAREEDLVDAFLEPIYATEDTLDDIGDHVDGAAGSMEEVADATDEQATSTAEVSSMVTDLGDRAGDIAAEIDGIVREVQRQDEQMRAIRDATDELRSLDEMDFGSVTDPGEWDGEVHETDVPAPFTRSRATDGGQVRSSDIPQSLRERLPDGMPDAIVATMDRETLEKIADGDIDKPF